MTGKGVSVSIDELRSLISEATNSAAWDSVLQEREAAGLAKAKFRNRNWKRCAALQRYEASPAMLGEFRAYSGEDFPGKDDPLATGYVVRCVYNQNTFPAGDQDIDWMTVAQFEKTFKQEIEPLHASEHFAGLAAELECTREKLLDVRKALRVQSDLFSYNGIDYSLILSSPLWEAKCRLEAAEQMLVLSLSKGAST